VAGGGDGEAELDGGSLIGAAILTPDVTEVEDGIGVTKGNRLKLTAEGVGKGEGVGSGDTGLLRAEDLAAVELGQEAGLGGRVGRAGDGPK